MSKGDKDTRKDHKKYNEAVYWKIKELKSLAKYVEGEIEESWIFADGELVEYTIIEVLSDIGIKANRVKGKQLMSFIDFKADYYEVVSIKAFKGKITIELGEK